MHWIIKIRKGVIMMSRIFFSLLKDIAGLFLAGLLIFSLVAAFEAPYWWIVFGVCLSGVIYHILKKKN